MPANSIFPWVQLSDSYIIGESSASTYRKTTFENILQNVNILKIVLADINNGTLFFAIQLSNSGLYNFLLHHSEFQPHKSKAHLSVHQYIFHRADPATLYRFLAFINSIENSFPTLGNSILQMIMNTHTTPEQVRALRAVIPAEGIQFNAEFLRSLQFVLFNLMQRAHYNTTIGRRLITAAPEEHHTFMGTPIREIPAVRLLFIDDHYEDAEEIVNSMKMNAESGKKLFLNPRSIENNLFSVEAVQAIKQNSICMDFIVQYEIEQARLSQIELPDQFYNALQAYLMELYAMGDSNSDLWGFMTSDGQEDHEKLVACLNARKTFFETVKSVCDVDQQKALTLKVVSVSLRRGSTSEVKFDIVAKGEDPYSCVITQQIYLWAMLRAQKPDMVVPEKLRFHGQARPYDLGELPHRFEQQAFRMPPDEGFIFAMRDDTAERARSFMQELRRRAEPSVAAPVLAGMFAMPPVSDESSALNDRTLPIAQRLGNIQESIRRAHLLENRGEDQAALSIFRDILEVYPANREAQVAVRRLTPHQHISSLGLD